MSAPTFNKNALLFPVVALCIMGLLVLGVASADQQSVADQGPRDEQIDPQYSTGISGYSGNPATNGGAICSVCHSGGTVPTVTLSGPTVVEPGAVNTYSLTISGGQQVAGGLDVSATDGSLSLNDTDTQLLGGEIAHTVPRPVDGNLEVVWNFDWTAPMIPGPVTLYGSGNSVNLAAATNGDNASNDTLEITVSSGTALFRVNAGGPLVAALDAGPDWSEDSGAVPSPYHNPGGTASGFAVGSVDASVPTTTPIDIFQTERWDPVAAPEMSWTFPVGVAGTYEVRLYLANGCACTQSVGQRIFDVAIEGNLVLDDYDIVADVGHLVGTMKSFVVTSDVDLNIDFTHNVENPLINGIEILAVDANGFLTASPTALSFGLTEINTSSAPQSVTLTNLGQPGDVDITIGNVSIGGEFSHNLAFPQLLTPGQSIAFDVTFDPTLVGVASGTLTIDHDGNNTPTAIGLSGEGFDPGSPPISFGASNLAGEGSSNPTSLDFGPDDRLYVSQQNGTIFAYTIVRNGPNDYQVTATEQIDLVKNIPNHEDDDGTVNAVTNRQVTGLMATACPAGALWCIEGNTVLYVSSSDPRIGAGGGGNDLNLDTNSGTISRLAWNGAAWDHVQIIRGLPRSEENHSTNGMVLDSLTNTLYVMSGGNDNKGAPSNNFAATPEYALSAAMLSVDLDAIEALPTQTDGLGQDYIYDIPTLDDPIRGTPGQPDPGDPFGGNDGRNQARIVPGGPVQIYSPGYRNAYDVELTQAGRLYTFDNGPNTGWGGIPVGEGTATCTNELNEAESTGFGDGLHFVSGPGYYGGHPHPTRANPTGSGLFIYENQAGTWVQIAAYDWQTDFPDPPVPFADANPVECDYQIPGVDDDALAVIGSSTNGLAEYAASNFGGAMVGDLLAASFSGNIWRFELNAIGDQVVNQTALFSGFGSQPLDVVAQGDGDVFPGSVWVAVYGSGTIAVFEPIDFGPCTGAYDSLLDEDSDGYDNADEIDNGTDPCNGGSQPSDNDGDLISDLNDDDDDNDGILDPVDEFAIDPDNGTATNLPVLYPFFNNDPGSGFFGLGFTGLMINGTTDYLDQFDEAKLNAGGAAGLFAVEEVTLGDAYQTGNNQDNAFQFGVNLDTASPVFSVQTRINSPYFEVGGNPTTPVDFQSFGMFIGNGDQDNYLKIVFNAQAGAGGIEVLLESAGVASGTNYGAGVVGDILNSIFADLYVTVDPAALTAQPAVSLDGGALVNLGAPLSIPASWLDPGDTKGLAVGVISTAFGSAQPFGAIWDLIEITPGAAGIECTIDADCDDINECTADSCDPQGQCLNTPEAAATSCDEDGDLCTIDECNGSGACANVGDVTCPAGEVCLPATGVCEFIPADDDNDGLFGVDDPCPLDPRNLCFGAVAVDGTFGLPIRINASVGLPSSGDQVDCNGDTWHADFGFNQGSSFTCNLPGGCPVAGLDAIFGAGCDGHLGTTAIFQGEHWDDTPDPELIYDFNLPDGSYLINLLFSNAWTGSVDPGIRVFDISVEGVVAYADFDQVVAAGGSGIGVVRSVVASVTDGNGLQIELLHTLLQNPAIKGLEVLAGQIVEDADSDGFTVGDGDCDDNDPNSFPGAPELCDGNDNDCDSVVPADEVDGDTDGYVSCTGWNDTQGDDPSIVGGDDCDDGDSNSFPGNPELCDGNDNDCDAAIPADETDGDLDGYASCTGWDDTQADNTEIVGGGDCDDADDTIHPGATEIPGNGVDEDCDGFDAGECYTDGDSDGHGAGDAIADPDGVCDAGTVDNSDDCDDGDETVFPGAPEVCDAVDNNCDGNLDDAEAGASCDDGNSCTANACTPAGVCDSSASGACSAAGNVFYYRNETGEEPGEPGFAALGVADVPVELSGSVSDATTTDAAGDYLLSGAFGNVSVTPGPRLDSLNDPAVGSLDASRIAQDVVGLLTLTARQTVAGDVSGNGSISSLDASLVARYAVGFVKPVGSADAGAEHFPSATNSASDWAFSPTSESFTDVGGDVTADFEAILYGDVTGNWQPLPPNATGTGNGPAATNGLRAGSQALDAAPSREAVTAETVGRTTRAATLYVAEGPQRIAGTSTWKIVIGLRNADGIQGIDVVIRHGGAGWRVNSVRNVDLAGEFNLLANDVGEAMRISLYGISAMAGDGAFLELIVEGDPASAGDFRRSLRIDANEGAIPLKWSPAAGGAIERNQDVDLERDGKARG